MATPETILKPVSFYIFGDFTDKFPADSEYKQFGHSAAWFKYEDNNNQLVFSNIATGIYSVTNLYQYNQWDAPSFEFSTDLNGNIPYWVDIDHTAPSATLFIVRKRIFDIQTNQFKGGDLTNIATPHFIKFKMQYLGPKPENNDDDPRA